MQKRLVRVNSLGLAVFPKRLGCIEEERHYEYVGNQRCFVDEHHLYFSRSLFDKHPDDLVRQFAAHPFNRIKMLRCRHVQYHQIHSNAVIPSHEVMAEFLHESSLLQRLGVVVKSMVYLEDTFRADTGSKISRLMFSEEQFIDRFEGFNEEKTDLIPAIQSLEVVPSALVIPSLERFVNISDLQRHSPELLAA